ncbi:MAG: TonB-dependent receptor plug domain-containing protein, partial [Treponema sp.]|nr:TonB-dependent receptor plug domain-containing protein [Treponema sp.]
MVRFRGLFSKACALLFLSARLFAREISVYVEDMDLEIPLEGAVVRSWDGTEYVCDEEGRVLVDVPDDRQVVIHGSYPGYENGRLTIGIGESDFTLGLRLAGILENRELVFEASRPGVNETRTGRSVSLSEKTIEKAAEIGIIEDVMTAVKLLPGVGYTSMFNALPSIRGGHPGDLTATLDGFYIETPYFWGGAFSIFDPRMVKSAQLSHGVFSARYGHTISGLLEVTSQKPSPTELELELGVSTSVTNLALSIPLFGKGGIMLMGKVTYYDPVVWAAKGLSEHVEELEIVKVVSTTPYIRTGALTADYRINQDLSLDFTGFFGADGAGALYENESEQQGYTSKSDLEFDWLSYQLFLIGALTWNPRPEMMIKATGGWGYRQEDLFGDMVYNVNVPFSARFREKYPDLFSGSPPSLGDSYSFDTKARIESTVTTVNLQGRIDYDWDLGNGFLFALGAQELYSRWLRDMHLNSRFEEEKESYLDRIRAFMTARGLPFYPSTYD